MNRTLFILSPIVISVIFLCSTTEAHSQVSIQIGGGYLVNNARPGNYPGKIKNINRPFSFCALDVEISRLGVNLGGYITQKGFIHEINGETWQFDQIYAGPALSISYSLHRLLKIQTGIAFFATMFQNRLADSKAFQTFEFASNTTLIFLPEHLINLTVAYMHGLTNMVKQHIVSDYGELELLKGPKHSSLLLGLQLNLNLL